MTQRLPLGMLFILIILGLLSWCNGQCTAGQFMYGNNECIECPPGFYMERIQHSNKKCIGCATLVDPLYEVHHPCNATHNTVFRCAPNSFNSNGQELFCQECRVCEHVARNCTSAEDAICCPYGDMILQELMGNSTCETESLGNHKYCCKANTPSYYTSTNAIQLTTVPDGNSSVTEIKNDSSCVTTLSAQLNTSFGPESSTNSSYTNNEEMSVGSIVGISIGSLALVVIFVLILVLICRCKKKKPEENNGEERVSFMPGEATTGV